MHVMFFRACAVFNAVHAEACLPAQYDFQDFGGDVSREQSVAAVLLTASVRLNPPHHHDDWVERCGRRTTRRCRRFATIYG